MPPVPHTSRRGQVAPPDQELKAEAWARAQKPSNLLEGPLCPYCGDVGGELYEIEDRDDSVGYYAIETVCTLCMPRR